MKDCNLIDTSVTKYDNLSLDTSPKTLEEKREMANISYVSAIENLIYAIMCIHLNICYAIRIVSHYQLNPRKSH